MDRSTDTLVFPPQFPPTTRREKFFIGVRWLGPDLSFFKELKQQQGERIPEQMRAWGSGKRREIAELAGVNYFFRPAVLIVAGQNIHETVDCPDSWDHEVRSPGGKCRRALP